MAKHQQSTQSIEGELIREITKLTGREFVYEDGWCGMVPFDGKLSEMQTGPPVAFAELTWREQADVLRSFIGWSSYPERAWDDEYRIRDNITAGKQPEQWLEGTSLQESFRLLAEGKTPAPPKECPELTEQDLRAALGLAVPHVSGQAQPASAGAKAFQDVLRNDEPRETETGTQDRDGNER